MHTRKIKVTKDPNLFKDSDYQKVLRVVKNLADTDVLFRLQNNCIAASDMLQHLLHHQNIKSQAVEVTATITIPSAEPKGMPTYVFLGYDTGVIQGVVPQIDTHVVVITDTAIPMLIDLSIEHLLPQDHAFIVDSINRDTTTGILADYDLDGVKLTYQVKNTVKWPQLHQKNLVDRFLMDNQRDNKIDRVRLLVVMAIAFGAINFLINTVIVAHRLWMGS